MDSHSSVFVTGGAGYIGSHTCKALHAEGLRPIVYDNLSTGNAWAVKWGPLVQGDLAERDRLTAALRSSAPDTVIHFAAAAYVGESMRDPGTYFRNNVANTLSLLEAMIEAEVPRIVFSSSCATYGVPLDMLPITEDAAQRPVNPYGETKLMCERLIRWFGQAHGVEWAILRYFNAAGADPDGELCEMHAPETHLIPLVLRSVLAGEEMEVFGTDYETPDGTCVRDYVHVSDLAIAHVLAMAKLSAGVGEIAVNLGTGCGYSIRQVISAAEKVAGRTALVVDSPRRAGDPPVLMASVAKAREVLGWAPERSELSTILQDAMGGTPGAEEISNEESTMVAYSSSAAWTFSACSASQP